MNTLTIRQAVLADLEALAPLFDGYRQFYGQPSDISAAHAFLRARFEHGESFVFIALDGDTPVGWALPSSTRVSRPSRWRASSCSTTSSCMNARAGKAGLKTAVRSDGICAGLGRRWLAARRTVLG